MSRGVVTVMTAITGDRIIIGQAELNHAKEEHFPMLPCCNCKKNSLRKLFLFYVQHRKFHPKQP